MSLQRIENERKRNRSVIAIIAINDEEQKKEATIHNDYYIPFIQQSSVNEPW
jgi:hypothetical protein